MTVQEAKMQIEAIPSKIWEQLSPCDNEAMGIALESMEKQIPKKPRFYAHNYYCTECGQLVGNNEFHWQRFLYCDKCGKKLDWEGCRYSDVEAWQPLPQPYKKEGAE